MYKTLIFVVTFVLLCDIKVIISKPLSERQQNVYLVKEHGSLAVQGLIIHPKSIDAHAKSHEEDAILKDNASTDIIVGTKVTKEPLINVTVDPYEDIDTKKHYYLLKIKDFYDFLPFSRQDDESYLRLEIVDGGDIGLAGLVDENVKDQSVHPERLTKRDLLISHPFENNMQEKEETHSLETQGISDTTLAEFVNVLQTNFVRKRDIFASRSDRNAFKGVLRVKRDLGNFMTELDQIGADPDDPENNNYKFIAYVPFFRVRKYYLQRRRFHGESFT